MPDRDHARRVARVLWEAAQTDYRVLLLLAKIVLTNPSVKSLQTPS
jgi:hypothetical protein